MTYNALVYLTGMPKPVQFHGLSDKEVDELRHVAHTQNGSFTRQSEAGVEHIISAPHIQYLHITKLEEKQESYWTDEQS